MKNKSLLLLLVIFIISFCACRKIPKGTEISVSGNAKAYNIDGPIPNATVLIFECKAGMYGAIPVRTIDSTTTDALGNYSIDFKATGNGTAYQVTFRPPDNFVSYLNSPIEIKSQTGNTVNFEGDKLFILKSHFIVHNNSNSPLIAQADFGVSSYQYKIRGLAPDTTIFMYAFPDRTNIYQLYVNVADSPGVRHFSADTISLSGFNDTFEHTFQVDPSTFK